MYAFIAAPFYLLVVFYIFIRTRSWLRYMKLRHRGFAIATALLLLFLAVTPVIAMVNLSPLREVMKRISNYWFGILLYIIIFLIFHDIVILVMKLTPKRHYTKSVKFRITAGSVTAACIAAVSIIGMVHVHNIKVKEYTINAPKQGENMKAVLVADFHLGYSIDNAHMKQMTDKINAQDPDIVFVAGDIFDNDYEAIKDPEKVEETLRGINSKYGVYACWGNHDVPAGILGGFTFNGKKNEDTRMEDFLKNSNITLMKDKVKLINNSFYLIARNDKGKARMERTERKSIEELTAQCDKSKPIILLDHEPEELEETSRSGVDIDLCGHTHDGQMFPGNLTIKLFWENAYGYKRFGNMDSIVTSGVGIWGPHMRVGTDSEICVVNIAKTK